MSFTLSHVIQAANRAPEVLSSETAAYIVLSLAEQIMGAPREVTADSVLLHASGSLVVADVPHCSAQAADECLREVLAALLEPVAPPTVSNALRQVASAAAKGPVALRAELHAALVPLNRAAARRALVRLHRRVGTVLSDSVVTLTETGTGVERRGRRRAARQAPLLAEDIPVTLEVSEPQAEVVLRPPVVRDEEVAFWHPAQTTPWQFNEATHARGEGTPIFGSLAVSERSPIRAQPQALGMVDASPESTNTAAWQPGRDERTEAEAPVALRHQSELRAASVEPVPAPLHRSSSRAAAVASVTDHDTHVDHPVAIKPGVVVAPLRRASSRRSRVSDLVQRFATAKTESAERAVAELYHMATHAEGEFSALGTATPPPVARESLLPLSPAVKQRPRRIALKATLVLAPVVALWFMRNPAAEVGAPTRVVAAATPGCQATVRVSVPAHARVFLNDQQDRQEQSGPIAVFQKVACDGQAEVTVRVPEREGSPLPDAWVRVPLPSTDLARAATQGRALEVTPLAP